MGWLCYQGEEYILLNRSLAYIRLILYFLLKHQHVPIFRRRTKCQGWIRNCVDPALQKVSSVRLNVLTPYGWVERFNQCGICQRKRNRSVRNDKDQESRQQNSNRLRVDCECGVLPAKGRSLEGFEELASRAFNGLVSILSILFK